MSTYYVSAELSRYVDENGGKEFLARVIKEHRDGDVRDVPKSPAVICPHCGIRLRSPGETPCWQCGRGC